MKIRLKDLIQYYDMDGEYADSIQIVMEGCDWDEAYELMVDSDLLKPYMEYVVTDMRIEESCRRVPVLRVGIKKGENYDRLEKETDFQEVLGGDLQLCGNACSCVRSIRWNCGKDYCPDHGWGFGDCLYHRRRAC